MNNSILFSVTYENKLGANYAQRFGRKIKRIKHIKIALNCLIIKEMCLRGPDSVVARGFMEHSLNTADRSIVVVIIIIIIIIIITILTSRSQWPRGLSCRSMAARPLRSWVRIPPGAWMFVVSVVCC